MNLQQSHYREQLLCRVAEGEGKSMSNAERQSRICNQDALVCSLVRYDNCCLVLKQIICKKNIK